MDNTANKEEKSTLRAMEKSFEMQKESIKKKTKELSETCDVKACAVIIGPDGMVDTWPENRNDVQEVIKMYKNCDPESKRTRDLHGRDDHGKNKEIACVDSEGVKNPTKQELLRRIDAKLAQVRNRIQILKSKD
ncbi:unnamed protein product [Fraxinus pennsylvanica]|uniref:MADS-box domain-containing protein n=1 Tax=Fraxinus pennsylvanica TaxID=56036 RepID=A0AAD1YQA3_9LAMI|nr:unnamed protein product [Fraxinus pennsylvanica]